MTDDEKAIRQLVDDWTVATKKGDVETVLGLMTDDVIFMTPGNEPFGKTAFAEAMRSMNKLKIDVDNEIIELKVIGNFAFTRNRIVMTAVSSDNSAIHYSGYSLTILCKETDGRWSLMRDANLVSKAN